jgi:hypothetical protein
LTLSGPGSAGGISYEPLKAPLGVLLPILFYIPTTGPGFLCSNAVACLPTSSGLGGGMQENTHDLLPAF